MNILVFTFCYTRMYVIVYVYILSKFYKKTMQVICLFIAAIGIVKVLVNVPPFGDDVIPVVFH